MNGHLATRRRAAVRPSTARTFGWFAAASLVVAALGPWASTAAAAKPSSDGGTAICHATHSQANPYRLESPANAAQLAGHLDHTGPIWTPGASDWGDIIPPIADVLTSGMNWSTDGQAWLSRGCEPATPATPTPTATPDVPQGPVDPTPTPTPDVPQGPVDPTPTPTQAPTEAPTPTATPEAPTPTATPDLPQGPVDPTPTATPTPPVTPSQPALTPVAPSASAIVEAIDPSLPPTGGVGGVLAAGGSTGPALTLPPTDTVGAPVAPAPNETWRLVLLGLAALIASLLLMPDRTARRRS